MSLSLASALEFLVDPCMDPSTAVRTICQEMPSLHQVFTVPTGNASRPTWCECCGVLVEYISRSVIALNEVGSDDFAMALEKLDAEARRLLDFLEKGCCSYAALPQHTFVGLPRMLILLLSEDGTSRCPAATALSVISLLTSLIRMYPGKLLKELSVGNDYSPLQFLLVSPLTAARPYSPEWIRLIFAIFSATSESRSALSFFLCLSPPPLKALLGHIEHAAKSEATFQAAVQLVCMISDAILSSTKSNALLLSQFLHFEGNAVVCSALARCVVSKTADVLLVLRFFCNLFCISDESTQQDVKLLRHFSGYLHDVECGWSWARFAGGERQFSHPTAPINRNAFEMLLKVIVVQANSPADTLQKLNGLLFVVLSTFREHIVPMGIISEMLVICLSNVQLDYSTPQSREAADAILFCLGQLLRDLFRTSSELCASLGSSNASVRENVSAARSFARAVLAFSRHSDPRISAKVLDMYSWSIAVAPRSALLFILDSSSEPRRGIFPYIQQALEDRRPGTSQVKLSALLLLNEIFSPRMWAHQDVLLPVASRLCESIGSVALDILHVSLGVQCLRPWLVLVDGLGLPLAFELVSSNVLLEPLENYQIGSSDDAFAVYCCLQALIVLAKNHSCLASRLSERVELLLQVLRRCCTELCSVQQQLARGRPTAFPSFVFMWSHRALSEDAIKDVCKFVVPDCFILLFSLLNAVLPMQKDTADVPLKLLLALMTGPFGTSVWYTSAAVRSLLSLGFCSAATLVGDISPLKAAAGFSLTPSEVEDEHPIFQLKRSESSAFSLDWGSFHTGEWKLPTLAGDIIFTKSNVFPLVRPRFLRILFDLILEKSRCASRDSASRWFRLAVCAVEQLLCCAQHLNLVILSRTLNFGQFVESVCTSCIKKDITIRVPACEIMRTVLIILAPYHVPTTLLIAVLRCGFCDVSPRMAINMFHTTLTKLNGLLSAISPVSAPSNVAMIPFGSQLRSTVMKESPKPMAGAFFHTAPILRGGVTIPVRYHVLCAPRKLGPLVEVPATKLMAVLWFMASPRDARSDRRSGGFPLGESNVGSNVLLSLQWHDGTFGIALGITNSFQLLLLIVGGSTSQRSILETMPLVVLNQWHMIVISIPQYNLGESTFTVSIQVSLHRTDPDAGYVQHRDSATFCIPVRTRTPDFPGPLSEIRVGAVESHTDEWIRGSTVPQARFPMIFGSLLLTSTLLSEIELLLLHRMGCDRCLQLDFLDRHRLFEFVPLILRDGLDRKLCKEVSILASLMLENKFENHWYGGEQFPVAVTKDDVLCVLGVSSSLGRLDFLSRKGIEGAETDVFISDPKSSPFLETILDTDVADDCAFPVQCFNMSPLHTIVDNIGGAESFLWLASFFAANAKASEQNLVLRIVACIAGKRLGESRSALFTFLPAVLHSRCFATEETAQIFVELCSPCVLCCPEVVPLLLDFTLWGQNEAALVHIFEQLTVMLESRFNWQFFHHGQLLLDKLLVHLNINYTSTNSQWREAAAKAARRLLLRLCADAEDITHVVACAALLVQREPHICKEGICWILNLIEPMCDVVVERHSLSFHTITTAYTDYLLLLLQCHEAQIRHSSLILLYKTLPLNFQLISNVADAYVGRPVKATIEELRTLFCFALGSTVATDHSLKLTVASVENLAEPALGTFCLILMLYRALDAAQAESCLRLLRKIFQLGSVNVRRMMSEPSADKATLHNVLLSMLVEAVPCSANAGAQPNRVFPASIVRSIFDLLTEICEFSVQAHCGDGSVFTDTLRTVRAICNPSDNERSELVPIWSFLRRHVLDVCTTVLGVFDEAFTRPRPPAALTQQFVKILTCIDEMILFLLCDPSPTPHPVVGNRYSACKMWQRNRSPESGLYLKIRTDWDHIHVKSPPFFRRGGDAENIHAMSQPVLRSLCKNNSELALVYALQVSSKLLARKQNDDRAAIERDELVDLQRHMIVALCTRGSPIIQRLAILHVISIGTSRFDERRTTEDCSRQLKSGCRRRAPWIARDSILVISILKHRATSLFFLDWAIRAAKQESKAPPEAVNDVAIAVQIIRVLLYHFQTLLCQDDVELAVRRHIRCIVDTTEGSDEQLAALKSIDTSEPLFSPSCMQMLQYKISQVEKRTAFSSFPVAVTVTLKERHRVSRNVELPNEFSCYVLKMSHLYDQSLQEAQQSIAAYASCRFALLEWWGDIMCLYTEERVRLDRWQLDPFIGPEGNRVKLCRFLHDPNFGNPFRRSSVSYPVIGRTISTMSDTALLLRHGLGSRSNVQASLPTVMYDGELLSMNERAPIKMWLSHDSLAFEMRRRPPVISAAERVRHPSAMHLPPCETPPIMSPPLSPSAVFPGTDLLLLTPKYSPSEIPLDITPATPENTVAHDSTAPLTRSVILFSEVRALWQRRDSLKPVAVEILLSRGESIVISFQSQKKLLEVMSALHQNCRSLDPLLQNTESCKALWREAWIDNRISNFRYLMYLNWMSSRTYQNLREYPVFPQVLRDYESNTLNLDAPATFRDLSLPMGCQTEERIYKAIQKYEGMGGCFDPCDLTTYPHHHGSHYSPPLAVSHFLVRVQPFTDQYESVSTVTDPRLFRSCQVQWENSSTHGTDVKELIPELFCLPRLFINADCLTSFSSTDDADNLFQDVVLPPWANGSPFRFVSLHRAALESSYASQHLHHWIDLIFGSKSRGQGAVDALNVFRRSCYGEVDPGLLDQIQIESHNSQVDCMGNVPVQLFTEPHPQRSVSGPSTPSWVSLQTSKHVSKLTIFTSLHRVTPKYAKKVAGCLAVVFPQPAPEGTVFSSGVKKDQSEEFTAIKSLVTLPHPGVVFSFRGNVVRLVCLLPNGGTCVLTDAKDTSKEISRYSLSYGTITSVACNNPQIYMGTAGGAIVECARQTGAVQERELHPLSQVESFRISTTMTRIDVATAMPAAPSNLRPTHRKRIQHTRTYHGHHGAVTSLCHSIHWAILVSGGDDAVLAVWDTNRKILTRHISLSPFVDPSTLEATATHIAVNPATGYIAAAVRATSLGHIQHLLLLFSINGDYLAKYEADHEVRGIVNLGCIVFAAIGNGVWCLDSESLAPLREPLSHPFISRIDSIDVNACGTFLAACGDGSLVVWSVEGS